MIASRLNLVSSAGDRDLAAIRARLAAFDAVSGLDDLLAVLDRHARRGSRVDVLDAIGHSRSPGFLIVGTWTIDDSPQTAASFRHVLRPWLRQLGVRTIRLLGCSTAATDRARNAMRRIAVATGCDVAGTRRYISNSDYGPAGFLSDHVLDVASARARIDERVQLSP